jgi:hypothetical protein
MALKVNIVENGFTQPSLQLVKVTLQGTSPLMFNRMSEETLDGLRTKVKKPKHAQTIISEREEADQKLYKIGNNKYYMPRENVMACLVSAGTWVRLDGKRQLTSGKRTLVPAFVKILDEILPLTAPEGWEIDKRMGVNENAGKSTAICVVRPKFNKWSLTFDILIDLRELAEATYRDLFDKAGQRHGLGAFRLENRGVFGAFCVQCWEPQRQKSQKNGGGVKEKELVVA